jgi:NTE family protein
MSKIKDRKDVHYLSFEGGGGKGVTYLGALQALEELGVLPINPHDFSKNQIKGISGSSAGAITAMFLAMGYTSQQIKEVLDNQTTFTDFFDGPEVGVSRTVDENGYPGETKPKNSIIEDYARLMNLKKLEALKAHLISPLISPLLMFILKIFGEKYLNDPILKKLKENPIAYFVNLVYEGGLFPGLKAREFLEKHIQEGIGGKLRRETLAMGRHERREPDYKITRGKITFKDFMRVTGVDLVITGVNVHRKMPAVFSVRNTPDFPVAEAVGISMNLPILFKPVHVKTQVPKNKYNSNKNNYIGLWVDGGTLNNFPIHAFDHASPKISDDYPDTRPLNPNMLGIRLTDGYGSPPKMPEIEEGLKFMPQYLVNLYGSLMYPSEEGQLRSADEIKQTIDLYVYGISTTDFAPSKAKSNRAVREAKKSVLEYFAK